MMKFSSETFPRLSPLLMFRAIIDEPSVDTAVDKRAFLLIADISTKFLGCRHKIVP